MNEKGTDEWEVLRRSERPGMGFLCVMLQAGQAEVHVLQDCGHV